MKSNFTSLSRRAGAFACALVFGALTACSSDDEDTNTDTQNLEGQDEEGSLSFFVTSMQNDGDLGGLSGADDICQTLGAAAGAGAREWRAYLSAENGGSPIHARTRIGNGPWYNADGVMVAADLEALHQLTGDAELFLDENGEPINGQWNGVPPNEHDIMTGSDSSGMLIMGEMQSTCDDWTSGTLTPGPQVGHSDGMGPMMNTAEARFTSWNGGHPAQGCSMADLNARGGSGRFYCFAAD